jgi:hypothetical protein
VSPSRSRSFLAVPGALLAAIGVLLIALLLAAIGVFLIACGGGGGDETATPVVVPPPPPPAALFPLRIDAGGRHLVDASGNPFLLHIDTGWSLIADLSKGDAEIYLENRRQKGFNAVIVNLLERQYSSNAVPNFRNAEGSPPFVPTDDYSMPNEAYFAHADHVIKLAASKGIVVLLAPSYLGFNGGPDGWYATMQANAPKLLDYGRYLGQRLGGNPNIIWMHGGDFNPVGDKQLVRDIALGIKEFDTQSLHTAHCAPETSALDFWAGESWLQLNNVYTYNDIPGKAQAAYASAMPFFLLESRYENEGNPVVQTSRLRVQAYQALLSGAMGQAFGNHPIWHFDGPGVSLYADPVPANWEAWLDSPGALSMAHARALFVQRDWQLLVPDFAHTLLTGDLGGVEFDRAVAARASDGSFALAYAPNTRTLTIDMTGLAGPAVSARWFDPSAGTFTPVAGSPFPNTDDSRNFPTPGNNAAGASDWVLVLESV